MILRSYSLYDRKAVSYSPPFHQATDGLAVRSLQELVNDPQTSVGRYPDDFVLYLVGTFDTEKGLVGSIEPLVHVMDARALVKIQPPLPFDMAEAKGE